MKEDWVSWSEEPRVIDAENIFKKRAEIALGSKVNEFIRPMFGVDCIVIKPETAAEIPGALVSEVIPLPRFTKLFEEPIRENASLDDFVRFSADKGYNLEGTLRSIKTSFPKP